MKIDFHNHFYPPGYLEKFEQWGRHRYEFVPDKNGLKIVKQKGARFLAITPQHVSVEQRIADMDRLGIDMEVLTLTSPSVYFSTRKRNLYLAKCRTIFLLTSHSHGKRLSPCDRGHHPLGLFYLGIEHFSRGEGEDSWR